VFEGILKEEQMCCVSGDHMHTSDRLCGVHLVHPSPPCPSIMLRYQTWKNK